MQWSKKIRWLVILGGLAISWVTKSLTMLAGMSWLRPLSGLAALTVWLGIYMPRVQRSEDPKLIKTAWIGYGLAMAVMALGLLLPGFYGKLRFASFAIAAVFTIVTLLNQPVT